MMVVWRGEPVALLTERLVANKASSSSHSLNHSQVRWEWEITAKRQLKLCDQMHQGQALGDSHDGLHVGNALIQRSVAVGAVLLAIKAGWNDRSPKRVVAHGLQPLFHILIGLKTFHASIVPNLEIAMQIYGETS